MAVYNRWTGLVRMMHALPSICLRTNLLPCYRELNNTMPACRCTSFILAFVVSISPNCVVLLYCYSDVETSSNTLTEVLHCHRNQQLDSDKNNTYRITVRRTHIWEDAMKAFKRSFDVSKHLRITFLGEPAVDGGGPRREFFMLLMKSLNVQESLLEGPPNRRILRHNTKALDNEDFKTIGKIVTLSIIHGGMGPVFFSEPVIDYFFGKGRQCKAQVEDVPDLLIRDKLIKVSYNPKKCHCTN